MPNSNPAQARTAVFTPAEMSASPKSSNRAVREAEMPADVPKPKGKGGRPRGLGKVPGSGKRKIPSLVGKEARLVLAEESGYLELLCKVCQGRPVSMKGPTGKGGLYHYPTFADRRWAVEIIVNKLIPSISATELSGRDGKPIQIEATRPIDARETARRLISAAADEPPVIDMEPEEAAISDRGGATAPRGLRLEATTTDFSEKSEIESVPKK